MVVLTYANAMQIVRHSDLLGLVPFSCLGNAATSDRTMSSGIQHFELPHPGDQSLSDLASTSSF